MLGESVKLLIPQRMGLGFCEVEATGIQHLIQRHPRKPRFDEIGNRVQCLDNFPCGVEFRRRSCINLVEQDDIGKLDLIDQQIHQSALIFLAQ